MHLPYINSAQIMILGIVLGVIAAIVLVGLALLMLWKMVTTIHDRREFARFEKERMMAKWDTVSIHIPNTYSIYLIHITPFSSNKCVIVLFNPYKLKHIIMNKPYLTSHTSRHSQLAD